MTYVYSFNITTPSLDPLVGEDMTEIDMTDLECNSPVIIPQMQDETRQEGAQEQQHKQNQQQHRQLPGGYKSPCLILRRPKPPVEATPK